ncbi:MAG: inositol oxygenase family protein, partial [Myxococcota bacterium]
MSGKGQHRYRDFAAERRSCVREFYRQNHAQQTLEFVLAKKAEYLPPRRHQMSVWEALEFLGEIVDEADPDIELTQIDHALQTGE